MKRNLFLILTLYTLVMARGQTTYTYRLWFDGKPDTERTGLMSGNRIEMDVPVDDLDNWFHTLHFQARNADGDWSMPISRFFLIVPDEVRPDRTISGQPYRYWFDGDVTSERTGNMSSNILDIDVPVDDLDNWFHTFHFQTRDADGDWSMPISRYFLIIPDEVRPDRTISGQPYRYWFDGDVMSERTGNMSSNILDIDVPVDDLDNWFHTFHFQTRDADGDWSMPISRAFVIAPPMDGDEDVTGCPYRYWFDEDTVQTEGHMPGNVLETDIPVGRLGDGEHTIYFQVQNREGYWSNIVSGAFTIMDNTLIIHVGRGGLVAYNGQIVRDGQRSFSPAEGDTVRLTIEPDVCYRVDGVRAGNEDMAPQMQTDSTVTWGREHLQWTMGESVMDVDVTFRGHEERFRLNHLDYHVAGPEAKGATLTSSAEDIVVADVPETVTYRDSTWTVEAASEGVLADRLHLAAIVWRAPFTLNHTMSGQLTNPNLLLYIAEDSNELEDITNVIDLNDMTAEQIVLTDAEAGSDFFCPIPFTAHEISYFHEYMQQTEEGTQRGWETLALPFTVQTIRHETKGRIHPFAVLTDEDVEDGFRPFWLYAYTPQGHFVESDSIRAHVPYLISMPNEAQLWDDYILQGIVTFSATDATVHATEQAAGIGVDDQWFTPNFRHADEGEWYLLNVDDAFGGFAEGTVFTQGRRAARPFEAYFTQEQRTGARRYLPVSYLLANGIMNLKATQLPGTLYDLFGRRVKKRDATTRPTQRGLYIMNRRKVIVR